VTGYTEAHACAWQCISCLNLVWVRRSNLAQIQIQKNGFVNQRDLNAISGRGSLPPLMFSYVHEVAKRASGFLISPVPLHLWEVPIWPIQYATISGTLGPIYDNLGLRDLMWNQRVHHRDGHLEDTLEPGRNEGAGVAHFRFDGPASH
jgi:hypothetical protein